MFCTNCGQSVAEQAIFCPACGAKPFGAKGFCRNCGIQANPNAEVCVKCGVVLNKVPNASGQKELSEIPDEITGWNWGAFLLHWIWGIGNNTYIAFLGFIPLFGLVWIFVLGAKGNEWAWRNKKWESIRAFKETQKKWAIWGIVSQGLILFFYIWIISIIVAFKP